MTLEAVGRAPLAIDIDAAVTEVWVRAEAAHARSMQKAPGPSDAGSCLRRVGHMFHGTPPSNPPELTSPAATLGTWIHERFLPLLQDALGGEIEFETNTNGIIGHGDWHGANLVIDLKTKASAALSKLRLLGATPRQLWQGHVYAADRIARGETVDYVTLLYVARDTGEHYAVTYAYDPAITAQAMAWFDEARNVHNPDELPRGGYGPGLDRMCDGCPWLSRCWPNDQTTILDEAPDRDAAVVSALAMHEEASVTEADAKKVKAFAAAMVAAEPAGVYGEYQLRHQSSGWRLDQSAAKDMLIANGQTPPMNPPTYSPRIKRVKGSGVGVAAATRKAVSR